MLKKIVFISLFAMLSISVFCQEKITLKEEKFSDLVPQSFYKTKYQVGYLFKIGDGEYEAIGYKAEKLEEILVTDEIAYKEFKKFKKKIAVGKVSYWLGIGSWYGLYISSQRENNSIEQRQNRFIGSFIAIIGGTTTYLVLNKSAIKSLKEAVEIYNQNLS